MIEWVPEPERPVWQQVAEIIRERIETGVYAPRSTIPSIVQLRQEFGVGRNTALHVITHLAEQGYVKPVRSLGTFVRPREDWVPAPKK